MAFKKVSYNPAENVVKVETEVRYYDYIEHDEEGFVVLEKYHARLEKHTFSMVDGDMMEYKRKITTFYRNGSEDYGSCGPGDTSDNPKKTEETHFYQMPEDFSLEQGLNQSTMIEIQKQPKGARRR